MTLQLSGGHTLELSELSPLPGRIFVRALPQELTELRTPSGLLHLPQQAADYQALMQGEIVATGEGVSPLLPVGARVIVERFSKTPLNESGDVWVSWESAVIAVLSEPSTEEQSND